MKRASIQDELRDLVSFVHFKKQEKHPWRNVTISKIAGQHYILKGESTHCSYPNIKELLARNRRDF